MVVFDFVWVNFFGGGSPKSLILVETVLIFEVVSLNGLRGLLGPFWHPSGASWDLLEPSWEALGAYWIVSVPIETVSGCSWDTLGRHGGPWGPDGESVDFSIVLLRFGSPVMVEQLLTEDRAGAMEAVRGRHKFLPQRTWNRISGFVF